MTYSVRIEVDSRERESYNKMEHVKILSKFIARMLVRIRCSSYLEI